jgi:hypothetical protein
LIRTISAQNAALRCAPRVAGADTHARPITGDLGRNAPTVGHLRSAWPDLKTVNGTHYAEVLQRIYEQRVERLTDAVNRSAEPRPADTGTPELPLATPKRLRDADHLRIVAAQPCLICGRTPSHAHHVRFAQPRAMRRQARRRKGEDLDRRKGEDLDRLLVGR